ncbi:MAG: type IX secretion system outer membrane channel protein PorV [Porphyromonadaceae bacterium]|nr:type IX secretion system outer membrane channel protein PorV [Porphyromonadaceae bacterium]
MKRFFLLGLISLATTLLYAQKDQIFNVYNPLITGVPSLTIAPDAIGGGMGDVGIASNPTLASQYWNSSKYAMMESTGGLTLSYTPWLRKIVSDVDLAYLAGYYNLGEQVGTLSASLRYFSLGNIALRDAYNKNIGQAKPYEMSFDLGYSRKLAENFSMGVVLRFVASDLSTKQEGYYTGIGFGADVNGYYSLPIEMATGTSKLGLGFNISNIGTKISYDKGATSNFMPTNLGVGASYLYPFDKYNRIALNVDFNKLMVPSRRSKYAENYDASNPDTWLMSADQYNKIGLVKGIFTSFSDAPQGFKEELQEINFSAGLEYAYNEQFFIRAGYHGEHENKGNRKFFSAGAGFKWTAFRLDVGYLLSVAQNNPLDQTLRFTLSFDMDGLKELTD